MIIKRNLLCIKNSKKIDLGSLLLYVPYKNILGKFVGLATNKSATHFDPVSRIFDGLESIPAELKANYEAFLGVTSHYQHSQGGKGKYLEKKLASIADLASLNIVLSDLPLYFKHPQLHRKRGIFTQAGLSSEDRRIIRRLNWVWKGKTNISIDIGNVLPKESCLILTELKNRVDSGGTAGRREIWTNKFRPILENLKNNDKIFSDGKKNYSLYTFLKNQGISQIEMYVSILFNVDSSPATKEGDMAEGFFSSNMEGFRTLSNFIKTNSSTFEIEKLDDENLAIVTVLQRDKTFKVIVGALYGNQIPKKLFRKSYPINELLLLKYDDMWLGQLLTIDERTFLLKYDKNFMTNIKVMLQRDFKLRNLYNRFIDSEGDAKILKEIVSYLLTKFCNMFNDKLVPKDVNKERYLADVLQVLAASEA